MAAPSEGLLALGTPHEVRGAAARSHLPDGRCVGWFGAPGGRVVVDCELDVAPPQALVRRFGAQDFWDRWTRAECAAKLLDVPIVVWWHRHGLDLPPGLDLTVVTLRPQHLDPRLVVSVAFGSAPPLRRPPSARR